MINEAFAINRNGLNIARNAAGLPLSKPLAGMDKKEELEKAARGFEAFFINMMLKSMRETVEKSDLLEKSQGEEMFTSMFDSEAAKRIAERSNLGIARMVVEAATPALDAEIARLKANRAYAAAEGKE